jgi:hypothetical protein
MKGFRYVSRSRKPPDVEVTGVNLICIKGDVEVVP